MKREYSFITRFAVCLINSLITFYTCIAIRFTKIRLILINTPQINKQIFIKRQRRYLILLANIDKNTTFGQTLQ